MTSASSHDLLSSPGLAHVSFVLVGALEKASWNYVRISLDLLGVDFDCGGDRKWKTHAIDEDAFLGWPARTAFIVCHWIWGSEEEEAYGASFSWSWDLHAGPSLSSFADL